MKAVKIVNDDFYGDLPHEDYLNMDIGSVDAREIIQAAEPSTPFFFYHHWPSLPTLVVIFWLEDSTLHKLIQTTPTAKGYRYSMIPGWVYEREANCSIVGNIGLDTRGRPLTDPGTPTDDPLFWWTD